MGNKSAVFPMQTLGLEVDFVNSVQVVFLWGTHADSFEGLPLRALACTPPINCRPPCIPQPRGVRFALRESRSNISRDPALRISFYTLPDVFAPPAAHHPLVPLNVCLQFSNHTGYSSFTVLACRLHLLTIHAVRFPAQCPPAWRTHALPPCCLLAATSVQRLNSRC